MSSESDIDEFFDADDGMSTRKKTYEWSQESGCTSEEVYVTPFEKRHQNQEAERKSSDLQLRRKKLEEIRSVMSNDYSGQDVSNVVADVSEPESSVSQPYHIRHTDVISDSRTGGTNQHQYTGLSVHPSGLSADPVIEEQLEALSYELEQSGHLKEGYFKQSYAHSETGLLQSEYADCRQTDTMAGKPWICRLTPSFDSDTFFEDATESSVLGSGPSLNGVTDIASHLGSLGVQHKDPLTATPRLELEELGTQRSNSLPDKLISSHTDTTCHLTLQEPDIIQSTKSLPQSKPECSHVLRTDMMHVKSTEPVAPPRKKKIGRCVTSYVPEDSLKETTRAVKSRTMSESSILKKHEAAWSGLLPFLDLCSATQGKCHVVATEDSAFKGDSEHSGNIDDQTIYSDNPTLLTKSTDPDRGESEDILSSGSGAVVLQDVTSAEETRDICKAQDGYQEETTHTEVEPLKCVQQHQQTLTDKEILGQVMVTNLDTGEKMPLSDAEDKLSNTMNPLSLHIMRRTKEYTTDITMQRGKHKDLEDHGKVVKTVKVPRKAGRKLKKFLSKSVRKIKSELKSTKEEKNSSSDEEELVDGRRMIKIKASHSHKGPYDFDLLVPIQNLAEDSSGAVWTMKFSHCGKLLATGGQDNLLKIWVVKAGYTYFDEMRQKYSEAASVNVQLPDRLTLEIPIDKGEEEEDLYTPFMKNPFCVFKGHTADLLDVSWSKNYFILSSSMDKTVRLWHVSRKECLCCFQHIDFVTAIAFHPKDDRYFLSGSLDGKLRLWSIPEKKVALWNEVSGQTKLITAANFCSDGNIAVGTYDGRCILYTADHLDYDTQIHVRSTRGKNAKGGKVTGVEPIPGDNKILVTSNDSRIRLYDLRDKTLTCKYKGSTNSSSRIKASFNHDGRYIICSSEDGCIYIWKTQHDFHNFYSVRRDRNDYWEGVKAHTTVVTASIFAPDPSVIIKPQFQFMDADDKEMTAGVRGEVLVSADFNGAIKVFINKFKPGSG